MLTTSDFRKTTRLPYEEWLKEGWAWNWGGDNWESALGQAINDDHGS